MEANWKDWTAKRKKKYFNNDHKGRMKDSSNGSNNKMNEKKKRVSKNIKESIACGRIRIDTKKTWTLPMEWNGSDNGAQLPLHPSISSVSCSLFFFFFFRTDYVSTRPDSILIDWNHKRERNSRTHQIKIIIIKKLPKAIKLYTHKIWHNNQKSLEVKCVRHIAHHWRQRQ